MNNLKHYCIHSVVWDICKRPLYKGRFTKAYINKCLELGLPLHYPCFYVKSSSAAAAEHYVETTNGAKMRRWFIGEVKNVTPEKEGKYNFCIDAIAIEQN